MDITLAITTKAGVAVVPKLSGARVTSIRWALNQAEGWSFELDPRDPQAAQVPMGPGDANEVQLWIDGVLLGWGPVVRRDRTTVQCKGCRWFFAHRFLGPVYSFMSSYDGSFEATSPGSIPTGWVTDNLVTGQVVSNFGVHGNKSLKVAVAPGPDDGYAGVLISANFGQDLEIEVSAWWQNTSGFSIYHDQGLVVVLWDATLTTQLLVVYATFDDSGGPEFNAWRRKSCKLTLPAGPHLIDFRLYAPGVPSGVEVHWDLLEVRLDQRTWSTEAEDASVLIQRLVEYATGWNPGGGPGGFNSDFVLKSDLWIDWNSANSSSVGRVGARSFDHSDHPSFEACLQEFPDRGLCDMDVTYTATTRKWTLFTPRKGSDRTTIPFALDEAGMGQIIEYDYLLDGEQFASQVRVPGPGRAGAESGLAVGAGVTIESISNPIGEADVNSVRAKATADLARQQAMQIPWIRVQGATALLLAGLRTGDTIHPRIVDGWINISGSYRVMAMEIDNPEDDVLTLTLTAA